jgi:hypothetical protein
VTPLQRVALQLCSPQLSLEYGESGLELDVDAELIGEEHDIGGLPALARRILKPDRKRWVGARARTTSAMGSCPLSRSPTPSPG